MWVLMLLMSLNVSRSKIDDIQDLLHLRRLQQNDIMFLVILYVKIV